MVFMGYLERRLSNRFYSENHVVGMGISTTCLTEKIGLP